MSSNPRYAPMDDGEYAFWGSEWEPSFKIDGIRRSRVEVLHKVMSGTQGMTRKGEPTGESLASRAMRLKKLDDQEPERIIAALQGLDPQFFAPLADQRAEALRHLISRAAQMFYRRGLRQFTKNARDDQQVPAVFSTF